MPDARGHLQDLQHALMPHRPRFSSSMGAKPTSLKLDVVARRIFGMHPEFDPEIKTFNSWSPDPWKVLSGEGAVLCTVSNIVLTVISSQSIAGKPMQFWNLSARIQSQGWTARDYFAQFTLDFTGAGGAFLARFATIGSRYAWVVRCNEDSTQVVSGDFDVDVFSAITSAHLSMPDAIFFGC